MLLDKNLNDHAMIDAGIASQTILLGAVEQGLGGCIIRTVNRFEIQKHFNLPDHLEIILVIALGKPDQIVKLTDIDQAGNIEYFEDQNKIHYVPKRSLNEVIINKKKP
jgi:nitroreductase